MQPCQATFGKAEMSLVHAVEVVTLATRDSPGRHYGAAAGQLPAVASTPKRDLSAKSQKTPCFRASSRPPTSVMGPIE